MPATERTNWKLVAGLGSLGLLMGAASVLGFTRGIEGFLWLVLAILCACAIAWKAHARPFRHGFLTGLLAGLAARVVQFLFFPAYLRNNPELVAQFAQLPPGWNARYFTLLLSPIVALVSGCALGLASYGLAYLARRRA